MLRGKACRSTAPATTVTLSERSLLSSVDLFRGLPAQRLNAVEHACRYRRFSPDELIIDRDAVSSDVFFVVRGRVRIVNYSVSGREIVLDDRGEGTYFGELSAIDGKARSASVRSIDDSLIVALPGPLFRELLAETPEIALRVMDRLCAIIRSADERIMDLSTLAAYNRVQAEVLRQARSLGSEGNTAVIEPIPIHSEIASRVSTTRETVARVFSDLTRRGILERTKDQLVIRNMRKLEDLVESVRN